MIIRSTTLRHILAPTVHIDWSQFEGIAALRCTLGVAIPLMVGLVLRRPALSAFGAVGAVSVGFGSFQGALYRSRAVVMLSAAAGMAIALFIGSLAGHSTIAAVDDRVGAGVCQRNPHRDRSGRGIRRLAVVRRRR